MQDGRRCCRGVRLFPAYSYTKPTQSLAVRSGTAFRGTRLCVWPGVPLSSASACRMAAGLADGTRARRSNRVTLRDDMIGCMRRHHDRRGTTSMINNGVGSQRGPYRAAPAPRFRPSPCRSGRVTCAPRRELCGAVQVPCQSDACVPRNSLPVPPHPDQTQLPLPTTGRDGCDPIDGRVLGERGAF